MNTIKIIGMLAGIIGTIAQVGYFTQAYRMFKIKESRSVSVSTYIIFLTSIVIWLLYGFTTGQVVLIIPNIVAVIGCVLVIGLYYKYRTN